MKSLLVFCFFLLGFTSVYARNASSTPQHDDSVYIAVDVAPKFEDGDMYQWISQHIVYPQYALTHQIEGKVFVSFIIEKNGSISGITILQGVDTSLNRETTRVISIMPEWKPGRLNGKKVRVKLMLPVSFKLIDYKEYVKENIIYCDTCVEKRAEFSREWRSYFGNHMFWTADALQNHAQGKVVVSFIIERDGSLSDIKVVNYDNDAIMLQDAAIQVIYNSQRDGKWTPGYKDGKPVRVRKFLTLRYIMSGDNSKYYEWR